MSSNTKAFEEKMKSSVEHLDRELAAVRAGRANPAVLDKVSVDYYGAPTPIQQVASVAVSEARTLTITPWDRTLLRAISKAIMASDVGITPIDDGSTIRLNFPAPTEERRKQLAKEVAKLGEEAKVAVQTATMQETEANKMAKQCEADGKDKLEVISSKLQTDVTTNVVTGKADVFYADSPVAGYAIAQTDGQLEMLGKVEGVAPEGIVIKKGDSQMDEAVQKAVQKLIDDGTYLKILKYWGVEDGAIETSEINTPGAE